MSIDEPGARPEVDGYVVAERLGAGGFATVYRARQESVGREVALKVITAGQIEPATIRRFQHEVQTIGALSHHPHVVAIFDAGTTLGGRPFISMQLVEGGSLGDRLGQHGPLPADEVATIGRDVADALQAAHAAGIVHRDIKPDNLLVGWKGRVLVSDFGIASLVDVTTSTTGSITGTIAYTAPEVFAGTRPTVAADVYSLGATLFALATGRPAFTDGAESPLAIMWRAAHDEVPSLPASVPTDLAATITACMAKAPTDRPPLSELLERLEAPRPGPAEAPAPPPHSEVTVRVDASPPSPLKDDVEGPEPYDDLALGPDRRPGRGFIDAAVAGAAGFVALVTATTFGLVVPPEQSASIGQSIVIGAAVALAALALAIGRDTRLGWRVVATAVPLAVAASLVVGLATPDPPLEGATSTSTSTSPTPTTTTTTTTTTSLPRDPTEVTVAVLNASSSVGVASNAQYLLEAAGYPVVAVGNAPSLAATTIYAAPEDEEEAVAIGALLALTDVPISGPVPTDVAASRPLDGQAVDVVVVLGDDRPTEGP